MPGVSATGKAEAGGALKPGNPVSLGQGNIAGLSLSPKLYLN